MMAMAWVSISVAVLCAMVIAVDEVRRPQQMGVMNIVWPVTALYLSVFALWAYFRVGTARAKGARKKEDGQKDKEPTLTQIALATSHCGAGCALADLATEFAIAGAGLTLFGLSLWASFVYDLCAAWLLGIAFQYFSIQPMRHLPPGKALLAAVKADTLSILAFQTGMYGWMALHFFVLAPPPRPTAFDPRYWLSMQVAMALGFATSFPMNRWLVRRGYKEAM